MDFRKAVAFFAHSDDEMVCAGTLHRLARQGCEVHVVTFAPAAIESDRLGGAASVAVVRHEWETALDAIGVREKCRYFAGMTPSVDLAPWAKIIRQIVFDYCEMEKPDAAFTLSPDDENPAHAIVGREAEAVLRGRVAWAVRCPMPWNYETGRPNLFVRLEDQDLLAKRAVIDAYQSQHFRYNYGVMLMNYAVADGMSVKVPAAERFELIRGVV